ncbi:MAG: bifunctional homocysteine S-methyltransferase/methylenetetrahydrofolate reductase [Actinomycetota bacterium]
MDAHELNAVLAEGPLVADGGMGTALIGTGAAPGACFEALNVEDPGRVERVHEDFLDGGAGLILTNTFGANRFRLAGHGYPGHVEAFNRAAVQLARTLGPAMVGGSMGPLGVRLAPYGRVDDALASAAYAEQATVLAEAGVDLLVIETQTDLREMELALAAAREVAPRLAIMVSAAFTRDDRTVLGSGPAEVAARLADLGADVIGVNCGEGPAQALRLIRAMRPVVGDVPLAARPNAGGPAEVGGRFIYPATPGYVAEVARMLAAEGVAIIGGCCGTGPVHTAAMVRALADTSSPLAVEVVGTLAPVASVVRGHTGAAPTRLGSALARGDFVVAVEMEPPRSFDPSTLVAAAGTLREAGADVVDVADSPMAKMRMSAWAACRAIQDGAGIETTLHFPTRGRNLLRLQGDLLGAHALGIRNVFVCVGDPVTIGDYPQALNDVDVTATGLLALITDELNAGRDRAGAPIGEPTSFLAGAALSPNAPDLDREVGLLRKKVTSGAAFLLSQPVYDVGPIERLRGAYEALVGEPLVVPILAGVLPPVTSRHAEFLHNEVPGIVIPDPVRERLRAAGDDAWAVSLAATAELIAALRGVGVAGLYVMPQFGRYDLAAEVIEAVRAS